MILYFGSPKFDKEATRAACESYLRPPSGALQQQADDEPTWVNNTLKLGCNRGSLRLRSNSTLQGDPAQKWIHTIRYSSQFVTLCNQGGLQKRWFTNMMSAAD